MNKEISNILLFREERNCTYPPSCFDDVICTLAHALNKEYKMFYSGRWKFLAEDTYEEQTRYSKLNSEETDKEYYKRMLSLQGFSIKRIELDQFWSNYCDIFAEYTYILAFVDGYELPWDAYYRKKHNSHAIIIMELDMKKNIVICCDPWHELESVSLEMEHFKSGIIKLYVPVLAEVQVSNEIHIQQFYQCMEDVDIKIFHEMRGMSDNISECSDFDLLSIRINEVAWSRWTLGLYLKSMKDISKEIYQYGVEMQDISNVWNNIKLSLIKCGILSNSQNDRLYSLLEYVKHAIYDNIEREYLLYMQIMNKETILYTGGRRPICKIENSKLKSINIQHLYNNSGISRIGKIGENTDFTGTGECFVIDSDNVNIAIGNGKENDNIICNGQEINFALCYINNLIIVGCCEWGNYSDYLILHYKDGKKQKVLISLSDWSEGPRLDEKIFISGYVYKHVDKVLDNEAYIYVIEIPVFSYVKTIILPKCSNMHIMAIQHD